MRLQRRTSRRSSESGPHGRCSSSGGDTSDAVVTACLSRFGPPCGGRHGPPAWRSRFRRAAEAQAGSLRAAAPPASAPPALMPQLAKVPRLSRLRSHVSRHPPPPVSTSSCSSAEASTGRPRPAHSLAARLLGYAALRGRGRRGGTSATLPAPRRGLAAARRGQDPAQEVPEFSRVGAGVRWAGALLLVRDGRDRGHDRAVSDSSPLDHVVQ